MFKFEIYTENLHTLNNTISKYFDGYTLYYGAGVWKGEVEASLIITIIAPAEDAGKVYELAAEIKQVNKQEAVLVTSTALIEHRLI